MKQIATVIPFNTKRFDYKKTSPISEVKRLLHDINSPLQTLRIIANGHLDDHHNKNEIEKLCIEKIHCLTKTRENKSNNHICLPNLFNELKQCKSAELNLELKLMMKLHRPWISSKISKAELENILSNLINNSNNASRGTASLKINVVQSKSKTNISIIDLGEGINSEQLLTLGQKGSSYSINGQGFGLNSAIRKIHHIGGEVFCRSLPQIGTQFTITLPS